MEKISPAPLRPTRQRIAKIGWSILHGMAMVLLTIWLQYVHLVRSDEVSFLKWMSVVKHNILRWDEKPLQDSIVFIDVSRDLELTTDKSAGYQANPPFQGPVMPIADRNKLAAMFRVLNAHKDEYRFLLCDILLFDSAASDTALKGPAEGLAHALFPATVNPEGEPKLIRPIFSVPYAVANYTMLDQSIFTEMPIYYRDTLKTLPVKMAEWATGKDFSRKHGLVFWDGKLAFNKIVTEFYYRTGDLVRTSADDKRSRPANTFYLGEILFDSDCFNDYLKGKYIVLGNFSADIHHTYLGSIPGSLILWDTFLTLKYSSVAVPPVWVLILFTLYFAISVRIFLFPKMNIEEMAQKIRFSFLKKLVLRYASYLALIVVVDLISYLFFETFISLFYLATYLTVLALVIEHWARWKQSCSRLLKKIRR